MPNEQIIPSYEQVYLLNKQLIANAANLQNAVITIGGQAVQYWVAWYRELYRGSLPDQRILAQSVSFSDTTTHLIISLSFNSL